MPALHQGQHPCHRGQAPPGVLGVLTPTATLDRRGEAHLWLLLEEALAEARAAKTLDGVEGVDVVRRRFRSVVTTLMDVGAVSDRVAVQILDELDTALSVRRLVGLSGFRWHEGPLPPGDDLPVRQRGDGWLEAAIEEHLDLVVDLPPAPHVSARMITNLAPQVRALRAVGSLRNARRLEDLVATLAAAGYANADDDDAARGEVDKGWLSFLGARPRSLTDGDVPTNERYVDRELGRIGGHPVRLLRVAWSHDVLQLDVDVSRAVIQTRWRASAYDDSGLLHLGQPAVVDHNGHVRLRLRPGLRDMVRSLSLRVTFRAMRLDEQIALGS